MLPACHRGDGQSVGTPDVCNTPTGATGTAPMPYVNTAQNSQATPFSSKVLLTKQNALYLASRAASTSGDEAGTAHGTIKGGQGYTSGSPVVLIEGQPGVHLTSATHHNNMNCPAGTVVQPSTTTVLYTRRSLLGHSAAQPQRPLSRFDRHFSATQHQAFLQQAAVGIGRVKRLPSGVGCIAVRGFGRSLIAQLDDALAALRRHGRLTGLVFDLRNNPGGELAVLAQLGGWCLGPGKPLLQLQPTGSLNSQGPQRYTGALQLLIGGTTASAAELLAASLRWHGRATLWGRRTAGKASVQQLQHEAGGGAVYRNVAEARLPDGGLLDGVGICPKSGDFSDPSYRDLARLWQNL